MDLTQDENRLGTYYYVPNTPDVDQDVGYPIPDRFRIEVNPSAAQPRSDGDEEQPVTLEDESPEIKLAVDLIMLLEKNELEPELVLAALDIVKKDYLIKAGRQTE